MSTDREKKLNRIRSAKFREKNPERSKQLKANWRMKNREYISKTKFEKQESILIAQAGRPRPDACELCGGRSFNKNGSKKIVFDHNHATGKFRGWLCNKCNLTLGVVNDDPMLLRAMANYLENDGIKSVPEVGRVIEYLEKQNG